MFTLKGRKDGFRLLLPKKFICKEIEEKYSRILTSKNSFYITPIDFLNETIQKVQVLGFNNATEQQTQTGSQDPLFDFNRVQENNFRHTGSPYTYRNVNSPLSLIDMTLNLTFRHTLGYLNYFLLFENFWYQFSRDRASKEFDYNFFIDIYNEKGSIYSRIEIYNPIIESMDMLDLDFSQPVAQSETFNVVFKYSNFDYQFIDIDDSNKSVINVESI